MDGIGGAACVLVVLGAGEGNRTRRAEGGGEETGRPPGGAGQTRRHGIGMSLAHSCTDEATSASEAAAAAGRASARRIWCGPRR
jgi:hypothetical protein